jgi:glyoxylase I family protein
MRKLLSLGYLVWFAVAPVVAEPGRTRPPEDQREKVLGIGGLFFRSQNPKVLAKWYRDNLGVSLVPENYDQVPWMQEAGPTAFAPFPAASEHFGDPGKVWMVNFRVKNLDAMALQLRAAGIEVKVDPRQYPNGRFARLQDPEGNPIELWEPKVEVKGNK